MNDKREKKILACYLKRLNENKKPFITSFLFKLIIWLSIVVVLAALLQLHKTGDVNIIILLLVSMLAGCVLGFVVLMRSEYKQWQYIKPYIDRNSIEERIRKLNT